MFKRFYNVFITRNLEFFRDRSAFGWNFVFPFLVIIGFAYGFQDDDQDLLKLGYLEGTPIATEKKSEVEGALKYTSLVPIKDKAEGIKKVGRMQLDGFVDSIEFPSTYWVNDTSANSYFLEKIIRDTYGPELMRSTAEGEQVLYIHWLIPGILGMNMMFSALFGVGYVIVRYRKKGVLKRLKSTPLSAFEFLLAQCFSRLFVVLFVTGIVYFGCQLFIDIRNEGSLLSLLAVFSIGSLAHIALGLVVAARVESEELAGGLLNLVSMPMLFLSGVWFSLEGLHGP